MKTPVLVDIETDGRQPFDGRMLLVGYAVLGEEPQVLEWGADYLVGAPVLQDMLADPERPVISMTKFDPRYLRLQGWDVQGPFYDIQVMAWVLNENQPLNLDALAKRYCGITMDKRIRRSAGTVIFRTDEGTDVPLMEMGPDQGPAWAQFVAYCRRDVEAEAELFQTLWERLEDTSWLTYFLEEEVPFTEQLLGMEVAGLPVNLADSEALREELEPQAAEMVTILKRDGHLPDQFNIGSGAQLAAYLYEPKVASLKADLELGEWACGALKECIDGDHEDCDLDARWSPNYGFETPVTETTMPAELHVRDLLPVGFTVDKVGRTTVHGTYTFKSRGLPPTEKTKSETRWSTSSPVLRSSMAAVQDPWVQLLLEHRKVDKALTTYLRRYPELAHEGRLYGRFNQTGTKTGRLSSSEPNLQNQPAHGELGEKMRRLFQGDLVVGDYSQLEPRLMAHFSEDPRLLSVYREGKDVYLDLAHGIFGPDVQKEDAERGIAKVLVLAMGYGAGHNKVAQILTINGHPTDPDTARGYLDEMVRYYHRFFAWRDAVIRGVKARGYVQTLGGRHRRLKAAFADRRNWKNVGYGERQAVNAVVQGSAGDIVRRVMVRGHWAHELRLLAQVHDELVFEWDAGGYAPSEGQLLELRQQGETAHGFKLEVPLVFEPHFGPSWFAAKEGELELPEDLAADETAGYAEEES